MTTRRTIWIGALFAGAAAVYLGWLAYLAWFDLVTLDVRDADVRTVVKKMERQTWESIFVDKKIEGKVTLNVRRMPLEEVLRMVAAQTSSRPTAIYPLYSSRQSLSALQEALRGEVDPATHGWTNLVARGMGGPGFGLPAPGFGGGFMAPGGPAPSGRVSLNILGKDLAFATLAFSRFAQTRVVPEDGTAGVVNLALKGASVRSAVGQLAKKVSRKWTKLYALQSMFGPGGFGGPGGPPQFVMREGNEPRGAQLGDAGPQRFGFPGPEVFEEMRKQRAAQEEELKQALPIEERQKLEQAQREAEKLMEEMANLSPEERRDRMMRMGGGMNANQMNQNRILNSTPEQRAQINQRMNQMRRGGPGGAGGPPR